MSDLGLGRMVAIRKPTGGTRGLVVSDFFRRLIARHNNLHPRLKLLAAHTNMPLATVQALMRWYTMC